MPASPHAIISAVAGTMLIVDDQASVREMLRDYMSDQGFHTLSATNGREALEAARLHNPDVILLDLHMPEMNGKEFLEEIRKESLVPIILLTAQVDEADRLRCMELGADDFINKPFSLREVRSRVDALLQARQQGSAAMNVLQAGDIAIDRSSRTVTVGSQAVELTPSEFEILTALVAANGRILSRQNLQAVLSEIGDVEHGVDALIRNLRDKLEAEPSEPRYLDTVFGVGYRFRQILA